MKFKANGKEYSLIDGLREKLKPNWQEMLKPAKERKLEANLFESVGFIIKAERELDNFGETLVGKNILEVGCAYGERSFLMAKYEGTKVHGIDVDDYICNQSPDLNSWNPKDIDFVNNQLIEVRTTLANKFPSNVTKKVTFETSGMEGYVTNNLHDLIISWDVLEHIIELPNAFKSMYDCLVTGGIAYHEYNSFFSFNGGHSLCTLDFLFGHCVLSSQDFERYIKEIRPEEEKIDLNFYHKCLNRATMSDIKELAIKTGFEVLEHKGNSSFPKDQITDDLLKQVRIIYPNVDINDLLCDSIHIILRKT